MLNIPEKPLNQVTSAQAVEYLNYLLKQDPEAVNALFKFTVFCSSPAIGGNTAAQVGQREGKDVIGLLGVLNGLFGLETEGPGKGRGRITVMQDLTTLEIKEFWETKNVPEFKVD